MRTHSHSRKSSLDRCEELVNLGFQRIKSVYDPPPSSGSNGRRPDVISCPDGSPLRPCGACLPAGRCPCPDRPGHEHARAVPGVQPGDPRLRRALYPGNGRERQRFGAHGHGRRRRERTPHRDALRPTSRCAPARASRSRWRRTATPAAITCAAYPRISRAGRSSARASRRRSGIQPRRSRGRTSSLPRRTSRSTMQSSSTATEYRSGGRRPTFSKPTSSIFPNGNFGWLNGIIRRRGATTGRFTRAPHRSAGR